MNDEFSQRIKKPVEKPFTEKFWNDYRKLCVFLNDYPEWTTQQYSVWKFTCGKYRDVVNVPRFNVGIFNEELN